jgi:hypothetical protein
MIMYDISIENTMLPVWLTVLKVARLNRLLSNSNLAPSSAR